MSEAEPRVLFCTDTYPPQVNGVSVVTALSVRGLEARGWRTHVVAPRYPAAAYAASGGAAGVDPSDRVTDVASVPLPVYPDIRLAAPAFGRVWRAVRAFAPDLVHCETEFVLGRLGQRAARQCGVPVVTSYHTDFSKYAASYGAPWLRPPVAAYLRRFHARARRTYTPSAAAAGDLALLGIAHAEVWGRGVDVDAFTPRRRSLALRDTIGVGPDAFTFLYVGRLAAEKSVDRVIAAYRLVAQRMPPGAVRLVIAGAGPRETVLRAEAPASVVFLGHLDREVMLPQLYASADAFVFASETETLGLVVLEAMASGLPVVAVPAGGVAEHLRDGVNGLAVRSGDRDAMAGAMARLVVDHALRHHLSSGARAMARTLSWGAELDRLDVSYRAVLGWDAPAVPRDARGAAGLRR
ncbi:MAG TPA: glycosyltransferase family 1 protein [Gemmatimonadaceae bacterium]|nr:glycosyltransferase family 1 protein [Gemmatimonadaceae bacterium]